MLIFILTLGMIRNIQILMITQIIIDFRSVLTVYHEPRIDLVLVRHAMNLAFIII